MKSSKLSLKNILNIGMSLQSKPGAMKKLKIIEKTAMKIKKLYNDKKSCEACS